MINEQAINALRCIAYVEEATPRDRIAACSSLFKSNTDVTQVRMILNHLITNVPMKDKDRVNAATLLLHIDKSLPEEVEQVDSETVTELLRNQYVRTA